jgi:hypothetical protein
MLATEIGALDWPPQDRLALAVWFALESGGKKRRAVRKNDLATVVPQLAIEIPGCGPDLYWDVSGLSGYFTALLRRSPKPVLVRVKGMGNGFYRLAKWKRDIWDAQHGDRLRRLEAEAAGGSKG